MSHLPMNARLFARKLYPQRNWFPIEAWDDERYDHAFEQMKAQPDELKAQCIAAFGCEGPTFSIVVPLFKTSHEFLQDMAESVLAQTYPRFELILVNASPDLPTLKEWIAEYATRDSRVKVVKLDDNYGITENTNRGITAATGDFVCFMDHDDWIEPDTLFEYAAAIQANNNIDLLYCDEDLVVKERGAWRHQHPLFKPEFSPELLICKNFAVHLLTVRKTLVDSLPTPGSEFDGAQDYNMTFMAAEQARSIHHVAKVLYHWRMSEGSTAANSAAKPYGKRAYRLSAQHHLERTESQGSIVGSGIVNIHNIWFHPSNVMKVSIVVTNIDGQNSAFNAFIEAFNQNNTYENIELVLASASDNALGLSLKNGVTRLIHARSHSSMYERFNAGAREASGDVLVFLDANCQFVSAEPVEQLLGLLSRDGVGIVAPKVLFADYTVKAYGIGVSGKGIVPLYRGYALDYPSYQCNMRAFQNTSAVGYQGLAVKRNTFDALGGFDGGFSGEIGSVDLCRRLTESGLRIATSCTTLLLTAESSPIRPFLGDYPDFSPEDIDRFFVKHPSARDELDPYRSPYLDLSSGYPVINWTE